MSRKLILSLFTCSVIMALMIVGLHVQPAKAQDATPTATAGTDETDDDVRMEVSGTVTEVTDRNQSITIVTLTTEDGETIEVKVNPASADADLLTVGAQVTLVVSVEDDGEEMVVKEVTLDEPEVTATPTLTSTPCGDGGCPPTATPTEVPTAAPTEAATCGGNNAHPVATRLAEAFEVEYDEIMAWHCQGMGFGNIAKAYKMAELLKGKGGLTAADYLNMKLSGKGWGQIMKDAGVSPNELAMGQVLKGKKDKGAGATGKIKKTKQPKGKGKGNMGD